MNKTLMLFMVAVMQCAVATNAMGAIAVKKAAPVAAKQVEKTSALNSILPTAINLIGTVKELKAQQQALTDECIPTSAEINFVDKVMKEWAMTGEMSPTEIQTRLGRRPCSSANGYAAEARIAFITEDDSVCYNFFSGSGNDGTIWAGYPKVGIVNDLCEDGSTTCKDKQTMSDIYDLFNLISFTDKDYERDEATMAVKITNKIEKCSSAKINARKKELWGGFLTTTMSTIGQKQNTGSIMEMVGGIAGKSGGGGLGGLGGLGDIAGKFLGQ